MKQHWLAIAVAAILCAVGRDAFAQPSAARPKSTKGGVYSREQAERGLDVYLGMCKSCHAAESHTGPAFVSKWNGKALSELYVYIRDQMPKNAPGSLTPEENADVLAYLLKLNRMPDGNDDLPSNTDALKSIRIETSMTVRKDR